MTSSRDFLLAQLIGTLERVFTQTPPIATNRYWVALSGGLDSMVLLDLVAHARASIGRSIAVIHVDHALSSSSRAWARFCARETKQRGLPITVIRLEERPASGVSVEAWARAARYRAIAACVRRDDIVLNAHHHDDQAETVLLNAMRGSGAHGLRGMPWLRPLGTGWLARPLLNVSQNQIMKYAASCDVRWIEDPSNKDLAIQRNYLRHEIVPRLQTAWPAATRRLTDLAVLQRDIAVANDEMADAILRASGATDRRLPMSALESRSPELKNVLLRRWIVRAGHSPPDKAHLREIQRALLEARSDAIPVLRYKGVEVRRYRGSLYLMCELPRAGDGALKPWHLHEIANLPAGCLSARRSRDRGVAARVLAGHKLAIGTRRGGERCRPQGRRHSQSLKKILQELGVPPWERNLLPLVYADGALVAMPPYFVCAECAAQPGEDSWILVWRWIR